MERFEPLQPQANTFNYLIGNASHLTGKEVYLAWDCTTIPFKDSYVDLNGKTLFVEILLLYPYTFERVFFKNGKIVIKGEVDFNNCTFENCYIDFGTNVVTFNSCMLNTSTVKGDGGEITIVNSAVNTVVFELSAGSYCIFQSSTASSLHFTTPPPSNSHIQFYDCTASSCTFVGANITLSDTAVSGFTAIDSCTVILEPNSVISSSNISLAWVVGSNVSVNDCILYGSSSTPPLRVDGSLAGGISNISLSGILVGASASVPIYQINSVNRLIGMFVLAGSYSAGTVTSTTNYRIFDMPKNFRVGRYVASSASTSHTVTLDTTVDGVLISGRNSASRNYSSITISGNSFTVTYSTATSADFDWYAW